MATCSTTAALLVTLTLSLSTLFAVATATSWVPASIEVPRERRCKLQQTVHAKGYQYYRFNGTAWVNFDAKARLYDSEKAQAVRVGDHFYLAQPDVYGGQPTWESGLPSKTSGHGVIPFSKVTCKSVSRVTVDQDSIQWVLLETTQAKGDKSYFGGVAYVQRINTKKGVAPIRTKGVRVGDVRKSPYTADYLFYDCEAHH